MLSGGTAPPGGNKGETDEGNSENRLRNFAVEIVGVPR